MSSHHANFSTSLCICTMNRPDDLDRCLKSVFENAVKPDQVIVSDDSADSTATQRVVAKYPDVIYQFGPRRGLSPNRNACIRQATGSHITFIDDDVCVPPQFVTTARKLIAASASKTILTGYEINHAANERQGEGRKVVPHNADFWGVQQIPVDREYRAIVINATIFPRSLFETALFDEHLRYGCDEIDIARHAVALGYKIAYQDELYVHHYPSAVNREQYKRFIHASRFYTTTKAYWYYEHSWLKALIYLIFAPLQLAASGLKRGNLSTVWKAIQATGIAYRYLFTNPELKQSSQTWCQQITMSQDSPLVSVLISNYNYDRYLSQAIESALNQTYPHLEIIVVDDGSTDDSRQIIASYGDRVIPIFKANGGQASALNAGFAASRGKLICLLDADDVWLPTKVEQVVQAFYSEPGAAVIYHRVQNVDRTGQPRGEAWPPYRVIQGNISEQVAQTGGWWPFPPSTGLSFTRSFLTQVMDIPETEYRICADAYLADLSPFFGSVVGIAQPLSHFRLHEANNWSNPVDMQRRSIQSHELRVGVLNRVLHQVHADVQVSLKDHLPYQQLKHKLGEAENIFTLSQLAFQNPWESRLSSRLKTIARLWIAEIQQHLNSNIIHPPTPPTLGGTPS